MMADLPVRPGSHLFWNECACKDQTRTPYPLDWRGDRLPPVIDGFEAVRGECTSFYRAKSGKADAECPVAVLELFRTRAYQQVLIDDDERRIALGQEPIYKAAKFSQHCEGRAIDGRALLLPFDEFANCVIAAAKRPGSPIKYIEVRKRWGYCHWDTSPRNPAGTLVIEYIN